MLGVAVWPRTNSRIPGTFVALVLTTVLVRIFHLPVETIHSRFGAIHAGLPHAVLPHVSLPLLSSLVGPAFTIAMLAGIESLLSAVVPDRILGAPPPPNLYLVSR